MNDDGNGAENYDGNDYDMMGDPNNMDGADPNGNGNGGDGEDPDVDQYFDDAGDIGYLPADHVTYLISNMAALITSFLLAPHAETPKRLDQATYRRAREDRPPAQREGNIHSINISITI